jgi:[acyl-carrier-protein] S-malonyltransferase
MVRIMSLALLFPGQGSQHVGMGKDLADAFPAARAVFQEADDVLGFSISRVMWEGPEEVLTETRNAQPALLVHSTGVHRVVADQLADVGFAAGHSLGEYSAWVAAGTVTFADALSAVRLRGELMFDAGSERPGTMAAVLGLDDESLVRVCSEVTSGVCVPANFNAEGQVVISGDREGVSEGMERAKQAGAKKVMELKVSGAFHSPLMEPASRGLQAKLEATPFADPSFPVVSNVTGSAVRTGAEGRALLVRQLTSPVRWSASIAAMVSGGATGFVELGAGSVLCGLNKRNAKGVPCSAIAGPAELEKLTAAT